MTIFQFQLGLIRLDSFDPGLEPEPKKYQYPETVLKPLFSRIKYRNFEIK